MLSYPVMLGNEIQKNIDLLSKFRKNMGLELSYEKARSIWGRSITKEYVKGNIRKDIYGKVFFDKLQVIDKNKKYLILFNWVKFIGISGSISAGFVKEEDDIDVFIVVRDGCAWIYRGMILILNFFNHSIRTHWNGDEVKDLFCINFISEERGLLLNDDLFNFHELMYIYPVYNERYLSYIYSCNPWLRDIYYVKKELLRSKVGRDKDVNIFIKVINYLSFISQICFISLRNRKEAIRSWNNYKYGRIEFYPINFKKKILKSI